MINETILNIDKVMPYVTWFGVFIVAGIALFLIHNLGNIKIFSKHDNRVIKQFLDKYPLVSPDFMNKSAKARDIENNQEIHELNKRVEHLEFCLNNLNKKVQKQLDAILKELAKRG